MENQGHLALLRTKHETLAQTKQHELKNSAKVEVTTVEKNVESILV